MAGNAELKIVFGAMTMGKPNTFGARVTDTATATSLLDIFERHGHHEVDTSRLYGDGSSEEFLATLGWKERGLIMDTKLYPTGRLPVALAQAYTHEPDGVRRGLMDSLRDLQTDQVDLFYLHGPDRKVPFEDTLREINQLHQEGRFARFGVSNFMAWEVAQICEISQRNGWIRPSVYQGVYHALQRSVEGELLPCLRTYGIELYAFQPLAGGFLTGRYRRDQTEFEAGSRFDPKIAQGVQHHGRYWKDAYFDALDEIHAAAAKYGLTEGGVALRWLKHHSALRQDRGDAIIVGASSTKHLEANLADLEQGPLPEEVLQAVDSAWSRVKGVVPNYWH